MKEIERQALLWASMAGIHNKDLRFIYRHLQEFTKFYLSKNLSSLDNPNWDNRIRKRLGKISNMDLESQYQILENMNIKTIVIEDKEYHQSLLLSQEPPIVLYAIGDIKLLEKPIFGIVGARKHTDYGARVCRHLIEELLSYDVCTVSGMALGIDTIVHKTTLDMEGDTIAILGNGIDKFYPKSNYHLWKKICEKGLIISEYPPGQPPLPYQFPERNRIISYLSRGLIVIEAKEKSGSLITARLAAESGKDVFAVPGNIDSIYSKGTNRLILDGAFPFLDMETFLVRYSDGIEKREKNVEERLENLEEDEITVYQAIKSGIQNLDLLSMKLALDTPNILATLTMLELKGYITGVDSDQILIK